MLGRDRQRRAKAEREGLADAALGLAAFRLVGDEQHRLAAAPQPLRWYLGRYARQLDRALRAWIAQDPALRYCSLQWALPHEMAIDKFHPGHGQYAQWARMTAEIIEAGFMRLSSGAD